MRYRQITISKGTYGHDILYTLFYDALRNLRIAGTFEDIVSSLLRSNTEQVNVQEMVQKLDDIFWSCCHDLPGAVTVRYSWKVYKAMMFRDIEKIGIKPPTIYNYSDNSDDFYSLRVAPELSGERVSGSSSKPFKPHFISLIHS
jgi:hypothetical protein